MPPEGDNRKTSEVTEQFRAEVGTSGRRSYEGGGKRRSKRRSSLAVEGGQENSTRRYPLPDIKKANETWCGAGKIGKIKSTSGKNWGHGE